MTVSRKDLTPGQQAVQAKHAAIDFCFANIDEAKEWHSRSNYIISLSVVDEGSLYKLSSILSSEGVKVTEFREPDLDNALTAIAFISDNKTKRYTSGLPLALKEQRSGSVMVSTAASNPDRQGFESLSDHNQLQQQ